MKRRAFMQVVGFVMTMVLLLSPIAPVHATAPGPRTMSETAVEEPPSSFRPVVRHDVWHGVSAPVRTLPEPAVGEMKEGEAIPLHSIPRLWGQKSAMPAERVYQDWIASPMNMPAPLTSFDGLTNTSGVLPPDTNGDVGINYYIQSVNSTPIGIFDKQTGNLVRRFELGDLWPSGDPCNSSDGDPIVLYDQLANRWLLSQFAIPSGGPYYQCIAISQSSDPLGNWYVYTYQVHDTKMNDYPHFGVWPDAYYMAANQFTNGSSWGGGGVWAFDRDAMLNGSAGTFIYFDMADVSTDYGGMLPADFDGTTPPPPGAPGLFAEWDDGSWIAPDDAIRIWEFHVDWDDPDNSTFGVNGEPNYVIQTQDVDPDMCGGSRNCIPQPGGSALDAIADRLMYRLQYRNFGGYQTLVSNHTVDVDGNDHAGIHWFELRDSGSGWKMYQEGVFAPDADHRWMGSIAVDHVGNIALGYSVSSASTYPSVRYAGRLSDDPLNTLPQGEGELVAGSGYQESSYGRWGDYSMMGVDPVDDCTFWYTQEYYATIGSAPWQTRIGSFKFPNCALGPQGHIDGIVYDSSGTPAGDPIANAVVTAMKSVTQSLQTASGSDGAYAFTLPTGTYTLTAQAYGYESASIAGVNVVSGTTTTVNIPMTATTSYVVSGTVSDAMAGWPLYAHITVKGDPISPPPSVGDFWTNPVSGFYSVTLAGGITYTFHVEAWSDGYDSADVVVGPLTVDQTTDITLTADMAACIAPGYSAAAGIKESFDDTSIPDGWTVIDNAGSGAVWSFNNPGGRSNNTGGEGNFAIADSDDAGSEDMDTELRTPVLDFSALTTVTLQFKYDFNSYSNDEIADVDVSNDGGSTWTNVWQRTGDDDRGPKTATIDISSIAGGQSNVMVRFHYYNANYDWYWEVDDVIVGDPSCRLRDGGLMVGNVYDGNTGAALAGASIVNAGGWQATAMPTRDPKVDDAFYTIFLPAGTQVVTATIQGYIPDTVSVTTAVSDTIWHDFSLPAGMFAYTPSSMDVTVDIGNSVTRMLTLSNTGSYTAAYTLLELDRGTTMLRRPVSLARSYARFRRSKPSLGVAPSTSYSSGGGEFAPLAGTPAYGFEIYPGSNLVHIPDIASPDNWNVVSAFSGDPFAADFIGVDFSKLYVLDSDSNEFAVVDTATGNKTVISTISPAGGEVWTGITGMVNGMFYAVSTDCGGNSTLYTINPRTGVATVIGTVSNGSCLIDIAGNTSGELYALDLNDVLVKIDPATAAGTIIGSIGFDANYAQSMDFNDQSGTLYLAAYNNTSGQGELRVADTSTGNTALVGAFPNGAEVDGFAIAVSGFVDLPWLSESPVSGTVSAANEQPIVVTFDASAVQQPGIYRGMIHVEQETPYTLEDMPVTMTVPVPPTWGKVMGVVSTSGHCASNFAPLANAEVLIQGEGKTYSTTTERAGSYGWWLDAGTYTVTILANGHISSSAQISVQAQVTSTQDFVLRAMQPCPNASPQSLQASLPSGAEATRALTLSNGGAYSYTFQMMDGVTSYSAYDSNDAEGPIYRWIEISPTAASLSLGDDEVKGPLPVGFDFPFYGNTYSQFYVSSNGFIAFSSPSSAASNQCPLPNTNTPNNLIALMWDDFDPGDTNDPLYYQSFSTCPYGGQGACLIVEYSGYHHYAYGGGGSIAGTFQAILFDYGSILIQFKDAGSEQGAGSTTGIENADGTEGVSYACNTSDSLEDELAVCFAAPNALPNCLPSVSWASMRPVSGTVMADAFTNVEVVFNSTGMAPGTYQGTFYIRTSDPVSPVIAVPLTMTVESQIYLPLVMKGAQP